VGSNKPAKQGRATAHELRMTAPRGDSGLYLLELFAGRHRTAVPVMVQSRERATTLVVLPALTWTATSQVDQDADGMPDTLDAGAPVRWPRVLGDGVPQDLYDNAAPLLRFLDKANIPYDLTSDLDLALTRNPRATDRKAVILAGPERWITRAYGRRLRRYVIEGGRVAAFGVESMRRGVTLQRNRDLTAGRLVRPTQPALQDPFGTRFGEELRRSSTPLTLSLIGGDAAYGLLEGFDGALPGFTVLEESDVPTGARGELLAGLGVETITEEETEVPDELPEAPKPAVAATSMGEGLVIRFGAPDWLGRLDERQVAQITRNAIDLIRGVEPQIRTAP
jgi:hypothetical protein